MNELSSNKCQCFYLLIKEGLGKMHRGISITPQDTIVRFKAPYHPKLESLLEMLHGTFCFKTRTWIFNQEYESKLREIAKNLYGTDGSESVQTVTVRFFLGDFCNEWIRNGECLWLFGRFIALSLNGRTIDRLDSEVIMRLDGLLEIMDIPVDHPDFMIYSDKVVIVDNNDIMQER